MNNLFIQMIVGTAVVYFFRYAKEWDREFVQRNVPNSKLTNQNTSDQIHTEDTDQI